MSLDTNLLGRCLAEFSTVDSLNDRFNIYVKYLNELHFEGVSYTLYCHLHRECFKEVPLTFIHSTEFPSSFIKQYTEDRFDQHDFTIRHCLEGSYVPADWQEYQRNRLITDKEADVLRIARHEHGIRNGITIPTLRHPTGIAGASIISTESDAIFYRLKTQNMPTAIELTHLFHNLTYAKYQYTDVFIEPLFKDFTAKEMKVLNYMASGRPMKTIRDHEGISFSYAMNLLSEMRNRLGGVNNDRLMYLYGLTQILNRY